MSKNTHVKQFLMTEIQKILLKDWDPIGIQDIPEAQDEYDSYISSVYKLIQSKKSENELFDYLWWIETEHMGLSGNKKHTKSIARKLFKLSHPL
ncbi:MAG: hypothetical protein K1000chlam3_01532 [Chlamydiae bacterium]|nr:hypothetical protein [Chlamydiota bacterium]